MAVGSRERGQMQDLLEQALRGPTGVEASSIFRDITEGDLPFTPAQKQFARDTIGPDTRTIKMKLASARNPKAAKLFSQLYPEDKFFRALATAVQGG